jgi:hypothetical protein
VTMGQTREERCAETTDYRDILVCLVLVAGCFFCLYGYYALGPTPAAIDTAKASVDFSNDLHSPSRWHAANGLLKISAMDMKISPEFKCGWLGSECQKIRKILSACASISEPLRNHTFAANIVLCNDVIEEKAYNLMNFPDSTEEKNKKANSIFLNSLTLTENSVCAQNDINTYCELRNNVTITIMQDGYLAGLTDHLTNKASADADRVMYERGLVGLDEPHRNQAGRHFMMCSHALLNRQDAISERGIHSPLIISIRTAAAAIGFTMLSILLTGFGFSLAPMQLVMPLISIYVYWNLPTEDPMFSWLHFPVTVLTTLLGANIIMKMLVQLLREE